MKYYKVKEESDQKSFYREKCQGWEIVKTFFAGELFTAKELVKINLSAKFIQNNFDLIEVNKNKTYFFFGTRRSNQAITNN